MTSNKEIEERETGLVWVPCGEANKRMTNKREAEL
jgi:hypothetical protein